MWIGGSPTTFYIYLKHTRAKQFFVHQKITNLSLPLEELSFFTETFHAPVIMIHTPSNTLVLLCIFGLFSSSFCKEYGHDTIQIDPDVKRNLRSRWLARDVVKKCILDVDIRCTVVGEDTLGVSCDDFVPPELSVTPCTETPTSATLLLHGDRCNDFSGRDDLDIECKDSEMNSTSLQERDWLYVLATDAGGQGMIYYSDWVRVGDNYELTSDLPLQYGIQIQTFDDENESNLLQTATYRGKFCAHESELFSFLGGSQIVGFTNAESDTLTPFQSSSYKAYIDVSVTPQSGGALVSVELESLTISTSFQGVLDLSNDTKGSVFDSMDSYEARIPITVNLLEKQDHSLLVKVTGNSGECVGAGFHRIAGARTPSS